MGFSAGAEAEIEKYAGFMLEHTPVGIALIEMPHFRLLQANAAYRQFLLRSQAPEARLPLGESFAEWCQRMDIPHIIDILKMVYQSSVPYRNDEFSVTTSARTSYWHLSVTPITHEDGSIPYLLVTAYDITPQIEAQRQTEPERISESHSLVAAELQRLGAIDQVARSVRQSLDVKQISQTTLDIIYGYIRPAHICLYTAAEAQRALRKVSSRSAPNCPATHPDLPFVPYESSPLPVSQPILQVREPVFVADLQATAMTKENPYMGAGVHGFIYIPLWYQGNLEGALVASFNHPIKENGWELQMLQGSSTHIASALVHARLHKALDNEHNRMRAVLDQLPEGILIAETTSGTISYANSAAAQMLGFSLEELTSKPLHLLRPPLAQEKLTVSGRTLLPWSMIVIRALCGETITSKETLVVRADDSQLITLASCAPLYNEDGIMTGAVIVFQDITTQKTVEQHKNEFFSIANHELRTPVTVIQGFAEILQLKAQQDHEHLEPVVEYALNSIAEQSEHLTHLIEEMLDISRLEQSQFFLRRSPCNILTLVHNVLRGQEVMARQHHFSLTLEGIDENEPLIANVDEERIVQSLNNLINNAVKYSSPGTHVEIGLRRGDPPSDELLFWVKDEGIGIPADEIPLIFKRFYRANNVDEGQSGFGIGLYLVKEVINRHGGHVWLESTPGKGSTFFFTLPMATPAT
ncbi:PAS domain S-box-containing protein [Thermosporothrix hazakensis]|jgi:two-component system phosphate regulon sensor histidine kinase PhoR|uniref:histidine kinase n=2 Tax=Thermosporothrix TaxID=768650 RepID=A0A326U429_THEHA|nr:ATP-binding protein [Thermosporothrix hazakensis]PZW27419.1 PAS domain S-box-containing protein [Thermosporothrix hazakensis]BBH85989.1 hypothetical protein KTC_07400 [Thermosporothrix sp. COM3]GCE45586.1 hypothetical protein KTH_04550 [Thermosporothrix hazakensis]